MDNSEPHWLSIDSLTTSLAENGIAVSRSQIRRWQKDGLLPRSRRRPLGRGRGTESLFPASGVDQLAFLAQLRPRCATLDHLAWHAWLQRFPVTPRIRRLLADGAAAELKRIQSDFDAFDRGAPNAIERAERSRWPRTMGHIPKAFRSTVMRIGFELRAGLFQTSGYDDRDFQLLGRFWARLKSDEGGASFPEALQWMNDELNLARELSAIHAASDLQLEAIRDLALRLWAVFGSPGDMQLAALPVGVFHLVFIARKVSPTTRWILSEASAAMRDGGYTSFEDAFAAELKVRRS